MAHEADDEQVEPAIFNQADDRFGHVAGYEMAFDLDAGRAGLCLCGGDDWAKRWFASSFSSATSSMLAGKRGSSSTVTM